MGVNKVILLGNLGKDPEVRTTQSGTNVATLSLATGEKRKNASGVWEDHTEWHRVVCFGKQADLAKTYLKKGSSLFLEGKIRTNKWQDKTGQTRYTTEILCDNFQFVGAKRKDDAGAGSMTSEMHVEEIVSNPSVLETLTPADALGSPAEMPAFKDDDIPF